MELALILLSVYGAVVTVAAVFLYVDAENSVRVDNHVIPKADDFAEFALPPGDLADLYTEEQLQSLSDAVYSCSGQAKMRDISCAALAVRKMRDALTQTP